MAVAAKKAAKKAPAKKAAVEPTETPESDAVETEQATPAPVTVMEGVEYEAGYLGEPGDNEDYSIAAEVARLADSE